MVGLGIRSASIASLLALGLVVTGCSNGDSDDKSDKADKADSSQTESNEPALEGEEVEIALLSAVAPEGWAVDSATSDSQGIDLRQQLAEDSDATPMRWYFQYVEGYNISVEAAAESAQRKIDRDIEDGAKDLGDVEVDGLTLRRLDMGDGWYQYYGQTEPNEEGVYFLAMFKLTGAVDEAALQEAEIMLTGIDFEN